MPSVHVQYTYVYVAIGLEEYNNIDLRDDVSNRHKRNEE